MSEKRSGEWKGFFKDLGMNNREEFNDSFIYATFTLSNDETVEVFNYGG